MFGKKSTKYNQPGAKAPSINQSEMRLRVNEAIARAEMNGKKILKKELAAKIWENSRPEAQVVNMTNLVSGITKKVNPDWIVTLCKELECSADYLLGLSNE